MPHRITAVLPPARLEPYREYWLSQSGGVKGSAAAIASLYAWQVSISSAWYEVLAYTEMIVRHAIDGALREWNSQQGNGPEWLSNPAAPLRGILGNRTRQRVRDDAMRASSHRNQSDPDFGPHPRHGLPVCHDDLVAQLTFGNLVNLLPNDPPSHNTRANTLQSGYTPREHLWMHATSKAFPSVAQATNSKRWKAHGARRVNTVPTPVEAGYAVGEALERLRRLRNRVGHHEQTFRVKHIDRYKDAVCLVRAVNINAAQSVQAMARVTGLVAIQPRP